MRLLGLPLVAAFVGACVGTAAPGASGAPNGSSYPASFPPALSTAFPAAVSTASVPPSLAVGAASALASVGAAVASPVGTASTGAHQTPAATPLRTPEPATGLRTITLGDDGSTVVVAVGERVLVELGVGLIWTVRVADQTVLVRVPGVALILGAQGLYTAARSGSTLVAGVGDAACRTAVPPCMVPSRAFSVTVVVR